LERRAVSAEVAAMDAPPYDIIIMNTVPASVPRIDSEYLPRLMIEEEEGLRFFTVHSRVATVSILCNKSHMTSAELSSSFSMPIIQLSGLRGCSVGVEVVLFRSRLIVDMLFLVDLPLNLV